MKNEKQICMNCLGEFAPKDIYWVSKNGYQALHCSSCIKEKGITEFIPYLKPRKTKTKVEKTDIKKEKSKKEK